MAKRGRPADFRLTPDERRELERARRLAKARSDIDLWTRIGALLLTSAGKTREEAAVACDVKVRAVYRWQRAFRHGGIDALRTRPKPGAPRRLSDAQRSDLVEVVTAGPEAAGLNTGLWTSVIIADLIERRYGVHYSASRVRAILRELGFSVQYPRVRLAKADEALQKAWIEEELPEIERRVAEEQGTLFFRTSAVSNSPDPSAAPGRP